MKNKEFTEKGLQAVQLLVEMESALINDEVALNADERTIFARHILGQSITSINLIRSMVK